MSDAEATLKFTIRNALISNCIRLKINVDKLDEIAELVYEYITDENTVWALKEVAEEALKDEG